MTKADDRKPRAPSEALGSFFDFLRRLGGMHDCFVKGVVWLPDEKSLTLRFDDIYSNFQGLAEYPGREAGEVTLRGVEEISISLESREPLRIFEFLPEDSDSGLASIKFAPEGSIRVRFSSAVYPRIRL